MNETKTMANTAKIRTTPRIVKKQHPGPLSRRLLVERSGSISLDLKTHVNNCLVLSDIQIVPIRDMVDANNRY
jgi:hypothetical protein